MRWITSCAWTNKELPIECKEDVNVPKSAEDEATTP